MSNTHQGGHGARQPAPPVRFCSVICSVPSGPVERCRALTLFARSPDTVRAARDMTRAALYDWGLSRLVDDARLVVAELVGNVVRHAVPDDSRARPGGALRIDVTLRKWPKWLFLAVRDEDSRPPTFPTVRAFSADLADHAPETVLPDCGRGLLIVQRVADGLWWTPEPMGGKTVFCRFDLDGGPELTGDDDERRRHSG